MGLLSRDPEPQPASGVADGIEFEETFADNTAQTPAPSAPRLTVVPPTQDTDVDLVERIETMLSEWQARFEARLEQRRLEEERIAERRRRADEERLRAWRTELENQLLQRFAERRTVERSLPDRSVELRPNVREAIASATSARDLGRVLRDLLSDLATTSAFALSVHHSDRGEVAYRYRVASEDEIGAFLRRETLDDGPDSAVAHMDGWVRAHRAVRIGDRNATVYTTQSAVRLNDAIIGVLTLQTEAKPLDDTALARVSEILGAAAPRLAELRDAGAFRGA